MFHGSAEEAYALAEAIKRNCDCAEAKRRCGPHTMMLSQKTLDDLLFGRFMAEQYTYEEFYQDQR